ncbi:MAG: hypothetical protein PHC64_11090 [Candidatus Gastranaerophilales bacterium]|nr:hypothetical protein [Candidatus Gastranaerophilales bacterium]
MNKQDIDADIEMSFRQIISLTDLMLECDNNESVPNILTIRDIAQSGLNKSMNVKT